ncbi:hypothetical protein [uncultured Parabacteroides sp.]|uniref:hypothetical protein n=1 Tax=uncultured Parabacteroides sp. TaxID=512312 RepID=UPI0028062D4A|nr:hypothetical protein [uncultured Parabacteroides sp.]
MTHPQYGRYIESSQYVALFSAADTGVFYNFMTGTPPTDNIYSLEPKMITDTTATGIDLEYDAGFWTYKGWLFNGTIEGTYSLPVTIHAQGQATLKFDGGSFSVPQGTALTLASGEVTLETSTSFRMEGRYGLRVETGATCRIEPSNGSNGHIGFGGTEAAIHPEGGGTIKGLTQLTWPAVPDGQLVVNIATDLNWRVLFFREGMKSIAVNTADTFEVNTYLNGIYHPQEGYPADSQGGYTRIFPGSPAEDVSEYEGMRGIPKATVVIDGAATFDHALHGYMDIVVTSTGTFTVKTPNAQIGALTIREGGQVKTDNTASLIYSQLNFTLPNRNKWRAFTWLPQFNSLTSKENGAVYVLSGYTNAGFQQWADYDTASLPSDTHSPILIAGDGSETDTLTLSTPIEGFPYPEDAGTSPGSPDEALNTGVFLFRANTYLRETEMRNIYRLSDDGSRFELHEQPVTLRPLEPYVVANAATRKTTKSLSLSGMATGIGNVPADGDFRVWTSAGQLRIRGEQAEKVAVYTINGVLKYFIPVLNGEKSLALPAGVYLVRQGNKTVKVRL